MVSGTTDYYITHGRKIGDFFIGFVGFYICILVLSPLLSIIIIPIFLLSSFLGSYFSIFIIGLLYLLIPLIGIIVANKYHRRYISIGIISAIIIPLLLFGACLVVLGGLSSFGNI